MFLWIRSNEIEHSLEFLSNAQVLFFSETFDSRLFEVRNMITIISRCFSIGHDSLWHVGVYAVILIERKHIGTFAYGVMKTRSSFLLFVLCSSNHHSFTNCVLCPACMSRNQSLGLAETREGHVHSGLTDDQPL